MAGSSLSAFVAAATHSKEISRRIGRDVWPDLLSRGHHHRFNGAARPGLKPEEIAACLTDDADQKEVIAGLVRRAVLPADYLQEISIISHINIHESAAFGGIESPLRYVGPCAEIREVIRYVPDAMSIEVPPCLLWWIQGHQDGAAEDHQTASQIAERYRISEHRARQYVTIKELAADSKISLLAVRRGGIKELKGKCAELGGDKYISPDAFDHAWKDFAAAGLVKSIVPGRRSTNKTATKSKK